MNKTISLRFRFMATVVVAILAATIFIGGLCLYEVDKYIQSQAENFVEVTRDNEAAKINTSLGNMEKSVKVMESYLMDFFTPGVDIADREFQKNVVANAERMFIDVAKHTSAKGAISYYFRFNPDISDGVTGLFYSKPSVNEDFVSFEVTDILKYDKKDREHVGWYWEPYEAGEAIWMKPYHNLNTNALMISYVIPMYFEGRFIGVIGMDFDYNVLSEQVHSIELYENGFAYLENDGEIMCQDEHAAEVKSNAYSKKYMRTSAELVNGMDLVLSAKKDDIRQIRYNITTKIVLAVIVISALFMAIAVWAVKKIVDPLRRLTDAAAKLANGDYDVEMVQSDTSEIKLLSMAFQNMTMRLRERESLLKLSATRDSLTGLRNTTAYAAWVEKFEEKRKNKGADFGIVVLDLNDLKKVNDNFGHALGNKLISTAAKTIAEVFKRSPVFRVGGDEFVVVLQNSDLKNRETLFEQFKDDCANTFIEEEGEKIPLSIASGFARFDPSEDSQFVDVFKRADIAMYENKSKTKTDMR